MGQVFEAIKPRSFDHPRQGPAVAHRGRRNTELAVLPRPSHPQKQNEVDDLLPVHDTDDRTHHEMFTTSDIADATKTFDSWLHDALFVADNAPE